MNNEQIKATTKGKILITFSKEQARKRNLYHLAEGVDIEIADQFDPNAYSIEEAVVYMTNSEQTFFQKGDRVLVDYAVFTRGLHASIEMSDESRFLYEQDGQMIYWAYDGTNGTIDEGGNTSEVLAKLADNLLEQNVQVIAYPEFIILEPAIVDEERKAEGGIIYLYSDDRDSVPFFATVFASSNVEVKNGDEVLCEPGVSIPIIYNRKRYEYIKPTFILGVTREGYPCNLKLLSL